MEKRCNLENSHSRLLCSIKMSAVLSVISRCAIPAYLLPIPTPISSIFPDERKRPLSPVLRRDVLRICRSKLKEDTGKALFDENAKNSEGGQWAILKPWDVPWDWKVTVYVMFPYLMSIFLTGLIESERQHGSVGPFSAMLDQLNGTDELAIKIFMDQLLKSVVKLLVVYIFVSPHQPFPDDVFSLEWANPFNFKNGWILWAVGGLSVASCATFVVKVLFSGLYASHLDNETEPLLRLLPIIGSSNISTVFLLGAVGIVAPICEEVLYRGFLLASLTKWHFLLPFLFVTL